MTKRITPAEVRAISAWLNASAHGTEMEWGLGEGGDTETRQQAATLLRLVAQMEADEEGLKGRVLVPVQFKPHWRSVPFEFADFMQGEDDPDWWNASVKQYRAGGVSKKKSYDALQAAIDEEAERRG